MQTVHESGRMDWFALPYEPAPRDAIEAAMAALVVPDRHLLVVNDKLLGAMYVDREARPISFVEATVRYWSSESPVFEGRMISQSFWPGGAFLSTVFLCINHAWMGGVPVAWETMLFPDPARPGSASYVERYMTELAARAGHMEAIAAYERGELRTIED